MSVGDAVCAVPFVWSKKGVTVTFVLWFDKDKKTLTEVSGLGAGKAAKVSCKKGVLKGSFTVYAVTGGKLVKNKFTVAGVLIDGVGYAVGTNKKLPAIPFVLAK